MQSVGEKHMLCGYPYYDDTYRKLLEKKLEDLKLTKPFELEFRDLKKNRIKMCAVASSSRLGFLHGVNNNIINFEKTDIKNGICKPHYDNYDPTTRTFYEYKCHEFCKDITTHNAISRGTEGYKKLIEQTFVWADGDDIDVEDLFCTFGIENKCMFFDFKQLLCHILGILSIATKDKPVELKYIMFVPKADILKDEKNKDILDWLDKLQDQIESIMCEMGEKKIKSKDVLLKDCIKLSFEYCDVSTVKDFIYEQL